MSAAGLLAIDSYVDDWLNLGLRWLHVVAVIAWIGSSFYFIALDYKLGRPRNPADERLGVGGEAWEVHGGGFYHVQKYRVAPQRLPERLLWFKWEAYTTWLSGFGLLIVLYYLNAGSYLVDPSVADLSDGEAIAISIALLAASWIVYDPLCRLLEGHDLVLAACLAALTTLAAWGCTLIFSGRGAYIQVGSMLATVMAGNVLFVIIPAHWELVRAKEAGREPDPEPGIRAKQRSVHNNYLTLPVVFTMISNHFSFTYGHSYSWLVLVAIMAVGVWIRLFFNLRHQGRTVWAIPISAAIALGVIAFLIRPASSGSTGTPSAGVVPFATARAIVTRRCQACHSAHPRLVASAPLGIRFDTPAEIQAQSDAIRAVAVDSRVMPLGNVTRMTDAERRLLGAWIAAGAKG